MVIFDNFSLNGYPPANIDRVGKNGEDAWAAWFVVSRIGAFQYLAYGKATNGLRVK